ncbi:Shedu anti-phage system protein SduA domain-containing protein [Streptomyces sp. NPDC057521]|uniref:Shedu anti-phage system protein SduA domain-containing protein n=1 Tax=Streptomyces sp. NPDC057521 TaxID=3346156 RepID=UPI003681306D
MTETNWQLVADALGHLYAGPTAEQHAIADELKFPLAPGTPTPVAAALLRAHLAKPLRLREHPPIDEPEYDYLARVATETSLHVPAPEEIGSRDLLDAWLEVAWARRTVHHLERLRPEVGDVAITVRRRKPEEDRYGQISSISLNGQLNFRGGLGRRAWPHTVKRVAKASDADHGELLTRAREEVAAEDQHPERVTKRELALLDNWKVPRRSSLADCRALQEALDSATEERPMQVVLENHPALLANMITGNHGVWVRPQVRLGDQYVSDFLIASETSAGMRWHLVELECPTARLTNAGNGRESPTLRHAIEQIQDWREWLKTNLLAAREKLPGITMDARGLIIMGREDGTDRAREIRDRRSANDRIEVRTYDWLLRAARRADSMARGLLDEETGDLDLDW